MKLKTIVIILFNGICFFVFECFIYRNDKLPWFFYLILAVAGLLYGWSFIKISKKLFKSHSTYYKEDEINLREEIIYSEPISHFRNKFVAEGGIGYLLKNRFIFIPYNFSGKKGDTLVILFDNILNITDFKFFGLYNTGLNMTIKSGKEERFVLDKKNELYKRLKNAKGNLND